MLEVTGTSYAISMALENGLVIAVATTYSATDVFINTLEHDE
jgi:hypothetical protein